MTNTCGIGANNDRLCPSVHFGFYPVGSGKIGAWGKGLNILGVYCGGERMKNKNNQSQQVIKLHVNGSADKSGGNSSGIRETPEDICECGHTKLHHFPNKFRSGINSHKTQPKIKKVCDAKYCNCKKFKPKEAGK